MVDIVDAFATNRSNEPLNVTFCHGERAASLLKTAIPIAIQH